MELKVRDLMTEGVQSVLPYEPLSAVYELMETLKVRHMPVVSQGELVGLISQRDLLQRAMFGPEDFTVGMRNDWMQQTRVEEIMVRSLEVIDPDASIIEAGETLLLQKIGCLPVVEGNRLVGILTESDFIRHVVEGESVHRRRNVAI